MQYFALRFVNKSSSNGTQALAYRYEVHTHHHLMMCIGNRANLNLFLSILTMLFLDEEVMISSNDFNCVEFKLPFTWTLATWGLFCGSVEFRYTWNLLTFRLRGGTVHGLWHSPSYAWLRILHLVHEMHWFCSNTIRWGVMTQFAQGNDYLF